MTESNESDAGTDRPTVPCPHCGYANAVDEPGDGEIRRGKTCRDCKSKFEVDLDELRRRLS